MMDNYLKRLLDQQGYIYDSSHISFDEMFSRVYDKYVDYYNNDIGSKISTVSRLISIKTGLKDAIDELKVIAMATFQNAKKLDDFNKLPGFVEQFEGLLNGVIIDDDIKAAPFLSERIMPESASYYLLKDFEGNSKTFDFSYKENEKTFFLLICNWLSHHRLTVDYHSLSLLIVTAVTSQYPEVLQYHNEFKSEERERYLKFLDDNNSGHIHRKSQIIAEYNKRKVAFPKKTQSALISEVAEWYLNTLTNGKDISVDTIRYYLGFKK